MSSNPNASANATTHTEHAHATNDELQKAARRAATAEHNNKRGSGGKWWKRACICLFFIVLFPGLRSCYYEKHANVPNVSMTAPTAPTAPVEVATAKIQVTLTKEPSQAVRVVGGRCIFFWMEDGRNRPEVTEVQILDTAKWLLLDEFFALPDTSPKKIALVRWSGTGTLAYELRPDGQCSSK